MLAFHGKPEVKEFYLARAKAHFDADEIIHGKYWTEGKGCAVGCLIHGDSHSKLAQALNIPIEMAHLIDRLFEGIPNGQAKSFPVRFVESIPVGAELYGVIDRYFYALLSDKEQGVILSANDAVRDPIQAVIDLFARQIEGPAPTIDEWRAAYRAADCAADRAAYLAADCAADRAAYLAAYLAADRAAYLAADRAAYSAADRAAYLAADRAAYSAAYLAGRSKHFIWQSEILLSLLANAPVPVEA